MPIINNFGMAKLHKYLAMLDAGNLFKLLAGQNGEVLSRKCFGFFSKNKTSHLWFFLIIKIKPYVYISRGMGVLSVPDFNKHYCCLVQSLF